MEHAHVEQAAIVDDDKLDIGVRLFAQRNERLAKPLRPPMSRDDGSNERIQDVRSLAAFSAARYAGSDLESTPTPG